MAQDTDTTERDETVIIKDEDKAPSNGLLIGLVIVAVIVLLFFLFGGANLFSGGTQTTNVETTGEQ